MNDKSNNDATVGEICDKFGIGLLNNHDGDTGTGHSAPYRYLLYTHQMNVIMSTISEDRSRFSLRDYKKTHKAGAS